MAGQTDGFWSRMVTGENQRLGHFIIQSGKFGIDGKVLAELKLGTPAAKVKAALLAANANYNSLRNKVIKCGVGHIWGTLETKNVTVIKN